MRIFQNLIGNAIEYRRAETPDIHVSVSAKGDGWLFSVQDNGLGFDSKFAERISNLSSGSIPDLRSTAQESGWPS